MATRRILVAQSTNDAISTEDIRKVEVPSMITLAASCVTLTDLVGLILDKTIIMDDSIVNIHAAALSLVQMNQDVMVNDTVIGAGTLRVPVTVTTSAIIHIQHDPIPA